MRITTRLKITSTITIAALSVLVPIVTWSLVEFKTAKNDYLLANTIKVNFFERASFRDQYFLYREDWARTQWENNKRAADSLLLQAKAQFHHKEDQRVLERLQKALEDTTIIFHRIVINTGTLKTATDNRGVYEELDKRLYSQLLMKANTVRDTATVLQDASARHIEQTYQYLAIIVGLFAVTLAFATILTSIQLDRLIRKRLAPLHDGAKIVADGNLDFRLPSEGVDEFSELALSINAMTDSLQLSNQQLAAELSAHKAFEIALRNSEERLQMALSGADMAVWDWHIPSGALVFNARWAEILGYTLEELPPRVESWETRVNPDDMPEVREKLTSHFKGETPIYISEHRVRHKDGHWVWVHVRGKVNGWDDDGNPLHGVGIALDISERKDIEQKLVRAHAELEQFANISAHHLQEPARRLVSFVQRLKASLSAEQLNEDATVSMNFIERSATRQIALVQDIQLYLAAAQPRGPTDKISPLDTITPLLEQRSTLIYETGAQVGYNCLCHVTIDRPRLKDIFGILLDNALQYRNPKITPQIRIDAELKAGRVIFQVADNGIGIPAEYRERVLGVFERLQVSEDQNSTGIGLAIVRRIVESNGGSISLHETLGGGVTVIFDLPG